MARIKIRAKMAIKLYENGELIHSSTYRRKASVVAAIQLNKWDKAYIRVQYPLGNDYFNDGTYEDEGTLLRVLNKFTEWDLIQEFSQAVLK